MKIENYLPENFVKDGSVDYTNNIQKAINANDVLTFPAFPLMVNDKGIIPPSGREITFLPGGMLIQKPTINGSHNAIRLHRVTDVILHNPVVVGDRITHLGTAGEWGHGISMYGCSNIVINDANTTKCWGDGIYLASTEGITNRNIVINRPHCVNNRRNGMAITSAIGLEVNDPYCAYNNYLLPMCGIDIEPSFNTDEIQNVVINNAKTEHHEGGFGIQIGFKRLFGGYDKEISVTINNHADKYSKAGLKVSASLTQRKAYETVKGTININNPFWRRNSVAPLQANILTRDIILNIINPAIQDALGINLTDEQSRALLTKKTTINRDANYTLTF